MIWATVSSQSCFCWHLELLRRRQWHPIPVLLPGKSHGRRSPGGLQSMGSLRVGHDWATSLSLFTFMHWRRKWQPTPVFLPGESQGGGAWWAAVYGVAQSRTQLKWLSSSSSRASQSSSAKNVINVISVLTIWWCAYVESSLAFFKTGCLIWPVCSLDKTLLGFSMLHFVLQGKTCLLLQVSLNCLLSHSSPLWWKGQFFLLVLEGLIASWLWEIIVVCKPSHRRHSVTAVWAD